MEYDNICRFNLTLLAYMPLGGPIRNRQRLLLENSRIARMSHSAEGSRAAHVNSIRLFLFEQATAYIGPKFFHDIRDSVGRNFRTPVSVVFVNVRSCDG